jgi:hypothetical protein
MKELDLRKVVEDPQYEIRNMVICYSVYKDGKFVDVYQSPPILFLFAEILNKFVKYKKS